MKILEANLDQILAKRKAGVSVNALRNEYGVSYGAMNRMLGQHGCAATLFKLSAAQQADLVRDHGTGMTTYQLADRYGINQMSVCNYLKRNGVQRHPPKRPNMMNDQFFKTLTPESTWVLGWYFSDGNVSKSTNQFSIAVHTNDEALLIKIQRVMGFNTNPIYRSKRSQMLQFYANDDTIHANLIVLGCVPNKSLIVRYPVALTEDWQHWAFLRGILEGDGHVSLKTQGNRPGFNCEIASGSLGFLQDIQSLLKVKLDINTSIIERRNCNSKRLCILGGKEPILRFLDLLYKDCPEHLRLERKYQTYLKMHEVALHPNLPMFANRETMRSGYFLSPNGQIYFVKGLKQFAKEFNVSIGCLINLLKTERKNRFTSRKYGWSAPTPDQIAAARAAGTLIDKIY